MAITGELITTASELRGREAHAVTNFAYAIAYHFKTAERMAVESPEELSRQVFKALADEYRDLARLLLTRSRKDMESHYAAKCDLIEKIKKDAETPGKVSSRGDERRVRKILGDVRYFLRYHNDYVSSECMLVGNLATRRILSESASLIERLENIFRRWDLGDLEWFASTMETWVRACMAARNNQPIDL